MSAGSWWTWGCGQEESVWQSLPGCGDDSASLAMTLQPPAAGPSPSVAGGLVALSCARTHGLPPF